MPAFDIDAITQAVEALPPQTNAGGSDVAGSAIDRHTYNNPMSAKVVAEIGGSQSGDVAEYHVESSEDGSTGWTAVTNRAGTAITVSPSHTTKLASADVPLVDAYRYLRVRIEDDNTTVGGSTIICAAQFIFEGGDER